MAGEMEALNRLCTQLYDYTNAAVRQQAERDLAELSASPECLQRCMQLLESGTPPYGPLVACTTLMKLLSTKMGILPNQRLELCRYLLRYIAERARSLPNFVVTQLCSLFARITKLEWLYFDEQGGDFPFRAPISTIVKSISLSDSNESMLAVQMINMLVVDINSPAGTESVSKHRKASAHFRDIYLLEIFELTVNLLQTAGTNAQQNNAPSEAMVTGILELCLNTLLFDFIGSLQDETSEENYNVQVPTSWRATLADGSVVKLFFDLYSQLPEYATTKILEILVQFASVRRTLFNSVERQTYLNCVVKGIHHVLQNAEKLTDPTAFHQFCRLVARVKANFQLCELIKVEEYPTVMQEIAVFTVQSLRLMDRYANGTYFLLSFWQRMVNSVPYVRTQDDHLLNVYCPEITTAFIESRLQNVEKVVKEGAEDPLDDQGSTMQVMEQLATICRCEYSTTVQLLTKHFDENAVLVQQTNVDLVMHKIAQGRLVWLVTLIGTAIFGKTNVSNADDGDRMDGELMARALRYMRYCNDSLPYQNQNGTKTTNIRLEVAFIHLLENFRRAYITDQLQQVSRVGTVYEPLRELGISDETDLLNAIVGKIITNIRYSSSNEEVLELSLSLLKDLSLGYSAVRRLCRLPDVQFLISNHTVSQFAFLGPSVSPQTLRFRTTFYEALTRIYVVELPEDDVSFDTFLQPLTDAAQEVANLLNNHSLNETRIKSLVVGLCRDIRGVAMACTAKNLFTALFDWMYPGIFNIIHRVVELWPDEPQVCAPVLRLLSELSQNRQQRLKFEMGCCTAVLLFKEVAKIVCAFGQRVLQMPPVVREDAYARRYKCVGICWLTLRYALAGAYVPYGVFRLYGDSCLDDSLDIFVKLFMFIPEDDFLSFPKLSQNYYHLLETVLTNNVAFISRLDPAICIAILQSLKHGVMSFDPIVITSACASLDAFLMYLHRRVSRDAVGGAPVPRAIQHAGQPPEGDGCLIAMKQNPELLAELLSTMTTALLFGDAKCQWSMSRPLLGLLLLQEDCFQRFRDELLSQQPPDRHPAFEMAFNALMENVERNLSVKNKDQFTQNLAKFRKEIVDIIKGKEAMPPPSMNPTMISGMLHDVRCDMNVLYINDDTD